MLIGLVACGASDGGGAISSNPAAISEAPGAVALPTPATAPSTTTPVLLGSVDCSGGAVEVTERILIERRRGADIADCSPNAADVPFIDCPNVCDEPGSFVDFDLDPAAPMIETSADGHESVSVRYAGRYATEGAGTSTEAETIVLTRSTESHPWEVAEARITDTSVAQTAARGTMDSYLGALRDGDYATAASLTAPASSIEVRDDLGRLSDEGMLVGTEPSQIANALSAWCSRGAECDATPTVEIEITSTHSLRAIVTYELDGSDFETTFAVREDGVVGLPIKVG